MLAAERPAVNRPALLRDRFLYIPFLLVLHGFGLLPRGLALRLGKLLTALLFLLPLKIRRYGMKNLAIAFPEKSEAERSAILKQSYRSLGRLLGEFTQFHKLTPENISKLVRYDGLEHYLAAVEAGRGVIFLTGHIGAWELSAYAHALFGHPLNVLVRPIDNELVNAAVERYRSASGNRIFGKSAGLKSFIAALKKGETVGILADVNLQRHQGIFCDFFGLPACSTPLVAALALRTGAAVVPGYLVWNEAEGKHILTFEAPVDPPLPGTDDESAAAATAAYQNALESVIRRHPDQWLWIHRRWKTRPEGEPDLY
jgi:Kdo2-lipid IVA lauroyltransferase/acyltransferase